MAFDHLAYLHHQKRTTPDLGLHPSARGTGMPGVQSPPPPRVWNDSNVEASLWKIPGVLLLKAWPCSNLSMSPMPANRGRNCAFVCLCLAQGLAWARRWGPLPWPYTAIWTNKEEAGSQNEQCHKAACEQECSEQPGRSIWWCACPSFTISGPKHSINGMVGWSAGILEPLGSYTPLTI